MVLLGSDIYKKSFDNSHDAQYVMDFTTTTYIAVNSVFCAISGYSREEVEGRLKLKDITPAEDIPLMQQIIEKRKRGVETERYLYRIKTKSGEVKPIEVSVRKITYAGQDIIIGSWRDLSERLALERTLRERVRESALASNRIMALTEKIKSVPAITTALMRAFSEESLIEHFCLALWTDKRKFAITGGAVYLRHHHHLDLCYNLNTDFPKRIDIRKGHPFVKSLESETSNDTLSEAITLVIKGRTEPLGVIHLRFDPKEIELLRSNSVTRKGFLEVIKTITDILGLAIENMRLSNNLKELSVKDGLTDAYNRRYFDRMMDEELKRAKRYRRNLSLLFLDLDNFKQINDKFGHKQGDIILREFAQQLFLHSRKIDLVCRYGGDEFAIILPETNGPGAEAKAEHLKEVVEMHPFTNLKHRDKAFYIRVSVGVSTISNKITTADGMVVAADNALFIKKGSKTAASKKIYGG